MIFIEDFDQFLLSQVPCIITMNSSKLTLLSPSISACILLKNMLKTRFNPDKFSVIFGTTTERVY